MGFFRIYGNNSWFPHFVFWRILPRPQLLPSTKPVVAILFAFVNVIDGIEYMFQFMKHVCDFGVCDIFINQMEGSFTTFGSTQYFLVYTRSNGSAN